MKYEQYARDCLDALLLDAGAEEIIRNPQASALFRRLNKMVIIGQKIDSFDYDYSCIESLYLEFPKHSLALRICANSYKRTAKKINKLTRKFYK